RPRQRCPFLVPSAAVPALRAAVRRLRRSRPAWNLHDQAGTPSPWTLDPHAAVECLDAVPQSCQPRSVGGVGATETIIAHFDAKPVAVAANAHRRLGAVTVLGDVGQRLDNEEVGGALDIVREALLE